MTHRLLLLAIATESVLAIAAVLLARAFDVAFTWGRPLRDVGIGIGIAAVLGAVNFVVIERAPRNWLVDGVRAVYHELLLPLFRGLGPISVVVIGAAAGVGEELLFRGVLQPLVGVGAASAVFGLVHIGGRRMVVFGVWAGVMGLVLGAIAELTGGLTAPIVAHAVYDMAALFYIRQGAHNE